MNKSSYFSIFANKLPAIENQKLLDELEQNCDVILLNKNEPLIKFQTKNRQIYFIVEGSFIRNIITSRGEEKL